MDLDSKFQAKLERLTRWTTRVSNLLDESFKDIDRRYDQLVEEAELEIKKEEERFCAEEENLQGQMEQAGKAFTQKKYTLEKEANKSRDLIQALEEEYKRDCDFYEKEIRHLSEQKTKTVASLERQKMALRDLYQDKKRRLLASKAGLIEQCQLANHSVREKKKKMNQDITLDRQKKQDRLSSLKAELNSKQEGWRLALETIQKTLVSLSAEKDETEKRLASLKTDNEKELESIRQTFLVSKEQLEIDKATFIEKAEQEEKQCQKEVEDLEGRIEKSNQELQALVCDKENRLKDEEEAFEREEVALKEALRLESEKRDYEQKLYAQQKQDKEKECTQIKEEYEKKKWYWDNQIRNLMMKKSVQEAEFDAERMRVDREARVVLKSLEAKRDEYKQTLAGIKNRHENLRLQSEKESQARSQRWQWRKDRLWSLWKNRLVVLKKERTVLQEQLHVLEQNFYKEKDGLRDSEKMDQKRLDDVQQFIYHLSENEGGERKQQEIKQELEKTRLLAQIKECETLITDWKDRLNSTQEEISRQDLSFAHQLRFIETFYREEEQQTELLLRDLQAMVSVLGGALTEFEARRDAA